jgi:hypothetical protein
VPQVFAFPPLVPSFDNAAPCWQLKAASDETATITIPVGQFYAGQQLDYRMFVEIFDGNDIGVRHGSLRIGTADGPGDTNCSETAAANGDAITLTSEGPCHHVISSFTSEIT